MYIYIYQSLFSLAGSKQLIINYIILFDRFELAWVCVDDLLGLLCALNETGAILAKHFLEFNAPRMKPLHEY